MSIAQASCREKCPICKQTAREIYAGPTHQAMLLKVLAGGGMRKLFFGGAPAVVRKSDEVIDLAEADDFSPKALKVVAELKGLVQHHEKVSAQQAEDVESLKADLKSANKELEARGLERNQLQVILVRWSVPLLSRSQPQDQLCHADVPLSDTSRPTS